MIFPQSRIKTLKSKKYGGLTQRSKWNLWITFKICFFFFKKPLRSDLSKCDKNNRIRLTMGSVSGT